MSEAQTQSQAPVGGGKSPGADLLLGLYASEMQLQPDNTYLRDHSRIGAVNAHAAVFDFYANHLPGTGRILDWGCCHAPDSCLIRARFGDGPRIDGCDVQKTSIYPIFHGYAQLHYSALEDAVRMPYDSGSFDAVVASGALEHVPMDYESLKELNRVLRPDGVLVVTFLPNRLSIEEWKIRTFQGSGFHRRVYGLGEAVRLFKRAGFYPEAAGYQTNLDLMPARSFRHRALRSVRWLLPLHRLNSTIAIVARKVHAM